MKIVIYGASEITSLIAKEFHQVHEITVIDKEENKTEEFSRLDIRFISCEALTIDVKGGSNSFPLNKKYKENLKDKNHYYIFVDYKGKFEDITVIPDIYIVPSVEMNFVREYDTKASNHRFNVLKNDIKEKFTNDLSIFVEEKTNGLVQ